MIRKGTPNVVSVAYMDRLHEVTKCGGAWLLISIQTVINWFNDWVCGALFDNGRSSQRHTEI